MAATPKKRVLYKTKSGSYVPEFMKVSSQSSEKSAPKTTGKSTINPEAHKKVAEAVKSGEVQGVHSTKVEEKGSRKGKKKFKTKKYEELVDKSSEDFKVPLELSNKRIYFVFFFSLIFVISSTFVIFFLRSKQPSEAVEEVAVEVQEDGQATTEQAETEEKEEEAPSPLERDEIKLEILNGSGKAGKAGETKAVFEALGYEDVEVGNSDQVVGNQLYINPDYDGRLEFLIIDAEENLDIASIAGELSGESIFARIILGK